MKVSREQAAANRERVLDTASYLLRERGYEGIGIAALMQSAGLTHGGFYGQFASKQALAGEVCSRSLSRAAEKWRRLASAAPRNPLRALAEDYLSDRHLKGMGEGCVLPALSADAARASGPVGAAMTTGVRGLAGILAESLPDSPDQEGRSLAMLAQMVGGLLLARAVDDPILQQQLLDASRAAILEQGQAEPGQSQASS